jgi:TIR domain-containing protein
MPDKPDDRSATGASRTNEPRIDVFLSFSRADKDVAQAFAKKLHDHGLSTWTDEKLQPGEAWRAQLEKVINGSRLCLVLVSKKVSAHAPLISKEWAMIQETAWRRPDFTVCPVLLDDADVPPFLRQWQGLRSSRHSADLEKAADNIAEVLRQGPSLQARKPSSRDLSETAARFSEIAKTLRESQKFEP